MATTARDTLLALATDKNAWPYPEQVTNLLDDYEAEVLAKAHARVAALLTANDGQLIAATREQILDTIIPAGGAR